MIGTWALGLVRRRAGRLLAAAFRIAIAVALLASLGSFLAASKTTMTERATSGVAVDWQVAVHPSAAAGDVSSVLKVIRSDRGNLAALPVGFADSPGFVATTEGTTQTTGAGKVLGLPASYSGTFPKEMRRLTGSLNGALVAQQTAANLRVRPGDTVRIKRAGMASFTVRIGGVRRPAPGRRSLPEGGCTDAEPAGRAARQRAAPAEQRLRGTLRILGPSTARPGSDTDPCTPQPQSPVRPGSRVHRCHWRSQADRGSHIRCGHRG